MSLNNLLLAIPIFFIAYQAMGLLWDTAARKATPSSRRERKTGHVLADLLNAGGRLKVNTLILNNKKIRDNFDLLLVRSGHPFGWKPETVLIIKEIGILLALLLVWQGQVQSPMAWIIAAIAGFWLPSFYLKTRGSARQTAIQRQFPGFVDLIALTLESGLDLLAAVERILDKMKPNPLREELSTLIQETRLGTARKEALKHLAFRTDLSDVQSFCSMVIQSEELGTSLASVLRNYADDMRNRRIVRAEEIAGKAPVKLLMPMVVFFFPIIFIVILGPIALSLISSYK